MLTKKSSIMNIITVLVFLLVLFIIAPIGTIIGYGFKKLSCTYFIGGLGVCTNSNFYDNYYAILDFVVFILPFWIILFIVWYNFLKKLKTN